LRSHGTRNTPHPRPSTSTNPISPIYLLLESSCKLIIYCDKHVPELNNYLLNSHSAYGIVHFLQLCCCLGASLTNPCHLFRHFFPTLPLLFLPPIMTRLEGVTHEKHNGSFRLLIRFPVCCFLPHHCIFSNHNKVRTLPCTQSLSDITVPALMLGA
jgi:hypothetical protein